VQTIAPFDFLQVFAQSREGGRGSCFFCKIEFGFCFFAACLGKIRIRSIHSQCGGGRSLVESQSSAQNKSVSQRKKGDRLLVGSSRKERVESESAKRWEGSWEESLAIGKENRLPKIKLHR
jgi:hypothetical protein